MTVKMHIIRTDPRPNFQRRAGSQPNSFPAQQRSRPPPAPLVTASAIRVKNLKFLREVVGEDNLAVLIGVSIPRTKELLDGVNFPNEMAFHVENELELPSGFLDQPNPTLSDDKRASLKSAHLSDKREDMALAGPAPSSPSTVIETEDKETVIMLTATKTLPKKPDIRGLTEEELREIRRMNFALLTERPMAKSKLAELTGLSAANISHRIHGNKIFDAQEAEYFSGKLGLDKDWFDTKQEEKDIPESVLALLTVPGAAPTRRAAAKKVSDPSLPLKATRAKGTRQSAISGKLPTTVAAARPAPAVSAEAPRATGTSAIARQSVAPVTARTAMAAAHGSAAEDAILTAGGGVGPIASALLYTLASKARNGSLSEELALKFLNEAAVL